jgi:hypothetical protein
VGVLRAFVPDDTKYDASQARLESLMRFENVTYQKAKSNEDYFHRIANKLDILKRKKSGVPLPDTAASPTAPSTLAVVAAQPLLPAAGIVAAHTTPSPPHVAPPRRQ